MSNYGVIWPSFWDSRTGRALVADVRAGRFEAGWLAVYLMTTKHANMLGAFAMPKLYMMNDAGLSDAQATHAITRLHDLDWMIWDPEFEFVWVREMAKYRMNLRDDEQLSVKDNRLTAVGHIYNALPSKAIADGIVERYGKQLRLKARTFVERRTPAVPLAPIPPPSPPPLPPPSKPVGKGRRSAEGTVQNSTEQHRSKSVEHKGHAFCSDRFCVPQILHDEFLGRIGGANVSIMKWYLDVVTALGRKPATSDVFKFWQGQFHKDIAPRLRSEGAVDDMLPQRGGGPVERMNQRLRTAARSAPILDRFKGETK